MTIDARGMGQTALNEALRGAEGAVEIRHCLGQRYLGSGMAHLDLCILGTPGNALGAYLGGGRIEVRGNAQDATGDTMSGGEIVVRGRCGDATGYAMRGGRILIEGDIGERAGIHMKQYQGMCPAIVAGGRAGRFLGEYMAGGLIAVLNLSGHPQPVGRFVGAGMHGGILLLRAADAPMGLPSQLRCAPATAADMELLAPHIAAYCAAFGADAARILSHPFLRLKPNASNPYHQLYTAV